MRTLAWGMLLLVALGEDLAAQEPIDPLAAAEPLVLTFRQGRTRLADGILAFRDDRGRLFLPLEEVSRGIGFGITAAASRRRAEGFYLTQDHRFLLDLAEGTVHSAGRRHRVEEGSVWVAGSDLYVWIMALDRWLDNVAFAFNDAHLLVEVTSDPPLPALRRIARDGARSGLTAIRDSASEALLPEVTAGYRAFSPPVIDVDSNLRWSSTSGSSGSTGLRGVQDLAGMGARWFLRLDQDGEPREARITLSRKDPAGGLLGPLGLTAIEIGDVGQFGLPLIGRGSRGMGVRLTNRPRDVGGTTIDLRGELLDGWEAELYRGSILIGFDLEPESGEYAFEDVALLPGINELTVVRHGPQGQREEATRTVRLGSDQPAPGTWVAEVSAILQERQTIALSGSESSTHPDRGEPAAEASFVFGLRPGVSLGAGLSTLSLDGDRVDFLGLSAELSPSGVGLTLDGAVDGAGNWAFGGRLIADVRGFGVFLQHEEFSPGFRSPASVERAALARRSRLRARRGFEPLGLPISTFLRAEYTRQADAASRLELRLGCSTSIGTSRINSRWTGTLIDETGHWELSQLDGRLNLALRRPFGTLRGGFAYQMAPRWQLSNISLDGSTRLLDARLRLHAALDHELEGSSSLGLGLGWNLARAELTGELRVDTEGSVSAGAGLRFSLGWSGKTIAPRVERESRTTLGLAYAQVFIDADRDGRLSEGERPLAGVRLSPARKQKTDGDGRIVLSGFPELVSTDVTVDEASLPDPFLRPTVDGYRVRTRPGAPIELAFPVVWVSDVEGMVRLREGAVDSEVAPPGPRTRGLGNVELVITDDKEREVRRVRSEFDGFFAVPNLPSGRYRLRIDSRQAARFGLDDRGGVEFALADDTAVLTGVELLLVPLKTAAVAGRAQEAGAR